MTVLRSAMITGGSRGIGRGVANHLSQLGWALTLVGRDEIQLARAKAELDTSAAPVHFVAGDLAVDETIDAAIEMHRSMFGSMNALILAAGVGSAGPIENYPAKRLDKQLTLNFRSPFLLVGRAMSLLGAGAVVSGTGAARVIALTSVESVYPEAGLAAYGASKAALLSLVRSITTEHGPTVTASAISPGFVNTDMSAWTTDSIPPETMISVDDVVRCVDLILNVSANAVLPHIVINRAGGGAYHA